MIDKKSLSKEALLHKVVSYSYGFSIVKDDIRISLRKKPCCMWFVYGDLCKPPIAFFATRREALDFVEVLVFNDKVNAIYHTGGVWYE